MSSLEVYSLAMDGYFSIIFSYRDLMLSIYYGDAAIATILQSMGPAPILIFSAIFYRKFPTKVEICAISLSILGIFYWLQMAI